MFSYATFVLLKIQSWMGTTELGCTSVIDNIKKLEMTYSIIDDWLKNDYLHMIKHHAAINCKKM